MVHDETYTGRIEDPKKEKNKKDKNKTDKEEE